MNEVGQKQGSMLLLASIICMTIALLLRTDVALQQVTAPAPRSHAVLRLSVASNDFGADAWPARVGAAGYIEVWAALTDADDYRPLVQIVGAPALPRLRVQPAGRRQEI